MFIICYKDFNPRTREGCDGTDHRGHAGHHHFNPRTREGCDSLLDEDIKASISNFNPRTREGCDYQ